MFKLRFLIYTVSIIFSGLTLFLALLLRSSWFGLIISNQAINYRQFFANETAILIAVLILLLSFMMYATLLHWLFWRPAIAAHHKQVVSELKEPFKGMPPETQFEKNLPYQQDWLARKIRASAASEMPVTTPKTAQDK